jgi:hypothetical protein
MLAWPRTTGTDASTMFWDIGHSADARERMKEFQIGVIKVRWLALRRKVECS